MQMPSVLGGTSTVTDAGLTAGCGRHDGVGEQSRSWSTCRCAGRRYDYLHSFIYWLSMALPVFFGCLDCSAVYRAMQHLSDAPSPGSFTCRNCGALVHAWHEQYVFADWRLFVSEPVEVIVQQRNGGGRRKTKKRPSGRRPVRR